MNRTLQAVLAVGLICGASFAAEPPRPGTRPDKPAAGSGPGKFAPNPKLTGLAEQTLKVVVPGGSYKGDGNVLDFGGMVYDHHRHKVLAFGGGHATAKFPNSVHEFDPATLKWRALTEDVPPSAYSVDNAVKTKDGQNLGGVRWKGRIWAGSRHTYDGLVMLPDKDLMVCVQPQEFVGGASLMPNRGADYQSNYCGGGVWTFDPVKRAWSVSEKGGLPVSQYFCDVNPEQPGLVYFGGANKPFCVYDTKTRKWKTLAARPGGWICAPTMTWCPPRKTFLLFSGPSNAYTGCTIEEYDPARNAWSILKAAGEGPSPYDLNIVWDSLNGVLVGLSKNGYCYYLSPAEAKWHKLDKKLPVKEPFEVFFHHIYDPVDNVHLLVGGNWETYAYKFSDQPGKLPGTTASGK